MTTPTPDLLPTVAHNVLRVLDGGDPDYIDDALWAYAWAIVETKHNVSKPIVYRVACVRGGEQRDQARELIEEAHSIGKRLDGMDRKKLRAELKRVARLPDATAHDQAA